MVSLDGSVQSHWVCQTASSTGCPVPRPALGSPCSQSGLFCNYGACSIPGGTAESCVNGAWTESPVPCPASAAQ
jgi:hypothetical protein